MRSSHVILGCSAIVAGWLALSTALALWTDAHFAAAAKPQTEALPPPAVSYAAAYAAARAEGRPLVALLTRAGCPPCRAMENLLRRIRPASAVYCEVDIDSRWDADVEQIALAGRKASPQLFVWLPPQMGEARLWFLGAITEGRARAVMQAIKP